MAKARIPESHYREMAKRVSYEESTGLFRWKARPANGCGNIGDIIGGCDKHGYMQLNAGGKCIRLHRLALYITSGRVPDEVDHVNGNRSDNRAKNLRAATRIENASNTGLCSRNTSGVIGVGWHKGGCKWYASIGNGRKCIHLGLFAKKIDAIAARRHAEAKYFGDFVRNEADRCD